MTPGQARVPELDAAALLQRVWGELVGLLGTAATAALSRRAIKRALEAGPELAMPAIRRDGSDYRVDLPESWRDPARGEALEHLRAVVRDHLHPILRELTGPVVARRLASVPELARAGLAGMEGEAYDGPEALARAAAFRPDVVFCDLGLPGMSGYDVARALRSSAAGAHALLVAVTGYGGDGDRRRVAEAGFDGHLVKPVSPAQLAEVLASPAPRR